MKAKVEVVYCDLCLPRRVPSHSTVTITGLPGGGKPVQRDLCLRHGRMLKEKPELDEPEAEVRAPVAELVSEGQGIQLPPPGEQRWGPTMTRLLPLILAEPGLHPREYATRLGMTAGALSSAAKKLKQRGYVLVEGNRQTSRYYPTKKAREAAA